ncbi:hypothetical protein TIFTF001_003448 [Ficus carica]|uniref:Gnk2-homologous domain-containing protein n=1 Tax=Ficus carica TaxID=3494 RepID=A0AA88DAI0_FICCA|nr:hypothetical protein TIFTF001_003448 [Ficus carica]
MVSSRTLLFVCLMFNILVTLVSAQKSFLCEFCENEKGNFTTNSTYQTNLKQVLSILPSTEGFFNGSGNSFVSVSYGQNSDEVYAIGLCQGDVEPHICRSCLNQSSELLTQTCPNQKEAIGWFDECMLRYSHRSLIGLMETHPKFQLWSTQNSSFIDMDSFSQDVTTLLENLKNGAAAGGSLRKYAAGNASVLDQFQTLYAFAQCTPDLSQLDCNNCLDEALEDFQQHNRSVGGRVFTPSCNFRYEVYPFDGHAYDTPPASRLQSAPLSPPAMATDSKTRKGNKSNKSRTVIIAVVSSVAAVVLIISLGNGFYTSSYGQNSDEVYAIGLCRGDVDPHVCCSCLNQSTQLLTQTCPNQKEAIGWFDECMLRYSNRFLIGLMETHRKFHSWSTQNSSFIDMNSFSQDVKTLLENLKNGAAAGGSLR